MLHWGRSSVRHATVSPRPNPMLSILCKENVNQWPVLDMETLGKTEKEDTILMLP